MSVLNPGSGSREQVHFVAGATGYVGRAVVAALRARGHLTWAHVRPDSRGLERWTSFFAGQGAGVEATPWEPEAVRATLARIAPTHVWALLGTTRARADRDTGSAVPETYEAVDYGLTRLLLDACATLPVPPVFVYLSAQGAKASGNEYYKVRARLEAELRASAVPWVIARPAFISGPDRLESRPVERAAAIAVDVLLGPLAAFGGRHLADRWRSISGPELGEGLVRLVADRGVVRRALDGGDWWPLLVRGAR